MLALPYRRHVGLRLRSSSRSAPWPCWSPRSSGRLDFFDGRSGHRTTGAGASTHFEVYDFIPDVLATNPFFGLGLNNFAVYYEFVTGPDRTSGRIPFYVAMLVETGLVGALFGVFVVYLFRRAEPRGGSAARSPRSATRSRRG